jgi:hypothetical protein
MEAFVNARVSDNPSALTDELPLAAIELGNFEALQFSVNRGCVLSSECVRAASRAHHAQQFYMLNFLEEHQVEGFDHPEIAGEVALNGRCEVLRRYFFHGIDENTSMFACRGGHLRCLMLVHNTKRGSIDANSAVFAAGNGFFNCLRYVIEIAELGTCMSEREASRVVAAAVARGDITVVDYLRQHVANFRPTAEFCQIAANNGDLLMLKYLCEIECPVNADALRAAKSGSTRGHCECHTYIVAKTSKIISNSIEAKSDETELAFLCGDAMRKPSDPFAIAVAACGVYISGILLGASAYAWFVKGRD